MKLHVPPMPKGDNAFAYLAHAQRELRRAGATPERIKAVLDDMQSSDYDHLYTVYRSLFA